MTRVVAVLGVAVLAGCALQAATLSDDERRWCRERAHDAVYGMAITQGVPVTELVLVMDDLDVDEPGRGEADHRYVRACQAAYKAR